LDFVLEALRKERTNRAIDDARREDFGVAWAAFSLDVAARNLSGGVRSLAVLDEQREEVERALGLAHSHRGHDHGFAELYDGRSRGLFGHAPRLDDEFAPRERFLNALHHCLLPELGWRGNTKRAGRNRCARAIVLMMD